MSVFGALAAMLPLAAAVLSLAAASGGAVYHSEPLFLRPPAGFSARDVTLFGYSAAFRPRDGTLLVGAPLADSDGALYSCAVHGGNTTCRNVAVKAFSVNRYHYFSREETVNGIQTTISGSQKYDHDLWLGATVIVTGENDIVTCAPRWSKTVATDKGKAYYSFGACYEIDVSGKSVKLLTSPAKASCIICEEHLIHGGGYGWSMAATHSYLFIGAPSVCTTGTYLTNKLDSHSFRDPFIKYGYDEDLFKMKCNKDNITAKEKDTHRPVMPTMNFGYAMAFGKFLKDHSEEQLVVSSLYGKHGRGEVIIMINDEAVNRFKDNATGRMFGASLCAVRVQDLTRNEKIEESRYTDLLVGVPLYTKGIDSMECGAVYLYLGGERFLDAPRLKLFGERDKPRSYFGSTIANLGDLDGDGFEEFAVGAPYEDDVGAVYVFGGPVPGSGDLAYTYRQRISPGVRGFGASITTLPDVDVNSCNEMAVGAVDDASVLVLRCPLYVTVKRVQFKPNIPLWMLPVQETSFDFEICVEVQYGNVKTIHGTLRVTTILNDGGASLTDENRFYDVPLSDMNRNICNNFTAQTDPDRVTDFMIVTMNVSMQEDCFNKSYDGFCAVLSAQSKRSHVERVTTQRGCGVECVPALSLSLDAAAGPQVELGSQEIITVRVTIKNEGQSAYNSCLALHIDGAPSLPPAACQKRVNGGLDNRYVCKPKPIFNGSGRHFDLDLRIRQLTSENKSVSVTAILQTSCNGSVDHVKSLNITFYAKPELISITGVTNATEIINKIDLSEQSANNKTLSHLYWINNKSNTTWENIGLEITAQNHTYLQLSDPKSQEISSCKSMTPDSKNLRMHCALRRIRPNVSFNITVPLIVVYKEAGNAIDGGVNITTSVRLVHSLFVGEDVRKFASDTTHLRVVSARSVKWWHIALATLLALLLLAAIGFAMYKSGFFKRAAKKDLRELKRKSAMMQAQRASRRRETLQAPTETPADK